ncbi:hypothetical protein DIE15_01185 [Burkholderia sp. Bp9031]|nr:hypothetical protein DIE15_01185 [Burkholderia sp. Bp9031]
MPARAGVLRVPTHTTDASRDSRCIGRVLPSLIAGPYDVRSNALAKRSPHRQRLMLHPSRPSPCHMRRGPDFARC